ncbi:MAG: hypothetical protein AAF525_14175, partial [Pseudomonadota bacterium]
IEVTPEGIKVTSPLPVGESHDLKPTRFVDIAIIVLALGVGFMYLERFLFDDDVLGTEIASPRVADAPQPTGPVIEKNSIAVLPFDNISASQENAYFAAGIHEDILNSLSQNPELLVTSRTSTLAFEGTRQPIAEIAEQLSVAYVMEGSVRRAGDRVRISVQLIEAATDRHAWSEAYEGTLEDVFALQVEVAENVANALAVQFGQNPQTPSQEVSTAAYDLFLEARDLMNAYEPEKTLRAIALFEQALTQDRDYVDAWAGLSIALSRLRFVGGSTSESNDRALTTAERAYRLDSESWYANYAMARHLGTADVARFNEANRFFEVAAARNPNSADVLVFYGLSLWWQGARNDAIDRWERAYQRDPLSPDANLARAQVLGSRSDREGCEAHVQRALRFAPDNAYIAWWAGTIYSQLLWNQTDAAKLFVRAWQINPEFIQAPLWMSQTARELGDYETSARWIDRARAIDPNHTGLRSRTNDNLLIRDQYAAYRDHVDEWDKLDPDNIIAQVYASAVHSTHALEAFEREDMKTFRLQTQEALDDALTYIRNSSGEGASEVQFWNSWMYMSAGFYANTLDDTELAHRLFGQLATYQESQLNPNEVQLVISYIGLGEHDKAIQKLNELLDEGYTNTFHLDLYSVLRDDFEAWDNIKNDVGFTTVVGRMQDQNRATLERLRIDLPEFFPEDTNTL